MGAIDTQGPSWPFISEAIPAALREIPRWAPWRAQFNERRGKFDKIPVSAQPPHFGLSTRDPNRWFTFEAAHRAYRSNTEGLAGVGYCMTVPHGIIGVDLDNCVDAGSVAPWAQEIVQALDSYTEVSPSGKGLRILALGEIPADWTNHEVGIEVYGGHEPRFLTITGNRVPSASRSLRAARADVWPDLAARYAKERSSATVISLEMPDILDEILLPDPAILPLPTSVKDFLADGRHSGDGSRAVFAAAVSMYSIGLADDEVFSILALNTHAMDVALRHRRNDPDRALVYLWVEQCCKGKAKSRPVTSLADFDNLTPLPAVAAPSTDPADDFEVLDTPTKDLAPATLGPAKKAERFTVLPAHTFLGRKPPAWLIKGLIPQAELVVLFGESGAGKSFIALDIACALARGIEWRGLKTKPGRQVYIAAEGAGGFRNRVAAYARHHEVDPTTLDLGVIDAAPNLLLKDDAMDVCRAINSSGPAPSVVWVDTFAQTTPGANENAAEDMGRALQHCKGIHRATGAVVVLVHHAGKDASKGARGWSGLRAAADAEIEVVRTLGGRFLRSTKQKDGEDFQEWGFDLPTITIGIDEDGEPITSCFVREAAMPVSDKPGKAKALSSTWGRLIREVMAEFQLAQSAGIEVGAVVDEVARRAPAPKEGVRDHRKEGARRALRGLCEGAGAVYAIEDGCVVEI